MKLTDETIRKHIEGYGLEKQGYEYIRSSSNEIYRLKKDDYILRFRYVGDPDENFDIIRDISAQPYRSIIMWKMQRNVVPCVESFSEYRDGWISTLWFRGNELTENVDKNMCEALRRLHTMDKVAVQDPLNLPRMNIIDTINARYEKVVKSNIDREIKDYLKSMVDISRKTHDLIAYSGDNTVHLDTYGGNLVEYLGDPCLIDLDTLSLGPWQYDHIVSLVSAQLFGDNFDKKYIPSEVFSWELYDLAVHLRKTDMFSWVCDMSDISPEHYKEMIKRYESLRYDIDYQWDKNL